jgi:hypothetical protein
MKHPKTEICIDTGSLGPREELVQRLDLFESLCFQLALARSGRCQLKIIVQGTGTSYPDGLVMDRIIGHCHVSCVRRREGIVVNVAVQKLRVGTISPVVELVREERPGCRGDLVGVAQLTAIVDM